MMSSVSPLRAASAGVLFLAGAAGVAAAPTYSSDPGGGSTTDRFDVSRGVQIIDATPILPFGGESLVEAFGGNGGVEPGTLIFADGAAAGTRDRIDWQTSGFINLGGLQIRLSQDTDGSGNRSARAYTFYTSQDGVNYTPVSSGTIPLVGGPGSPNVHTPLLISEVSPSGTINNVRGFRLELERNGGTGPRIVEIDEINSTPGVQTGNYLDRVLFNAASNSLVTTATGQTDEGPGVVTGYTVSSALGGDNPADAFGNNDGPIEPNTFLFADGGVPDNGNMIMGDGGETVDFIRWSTPSLVALAGYRLTLGGDGAAPDRDTELVRFSIGGTPVDLFDNDGFDGEVTRLFAGGVTWGRDFEIAFTRRTPAGGRIFEIDAIVGVPEPGSLMLLGVAAAGLTLRRRRSA